MTDEQFTAVVEADNNHVCIKVRDWDAAMHFYHDLVGLPVVRVLGDAAAPTFVWMPGVQLARRTEEPDDHPYAIFDHIGLSVANIAEICGRLDAAGFVAETPLAQRQLAGIAQQLMSAFYRDPDGNKVEFVHWL